MKRDIALTISGTAICAVVMIALMITFNISKSLGYFVLSLVIISTVSFLFYLWTEVTSVTKTGEVNFKNTLRRSA